jgi:hypothetical protein
LGGLEEVAGGLAVEQREQLAQRPAAVADQAHLDRVAETDPGRIDVDLHGAGLTGPG